MASPIASDPHAHQSLLSDGPSVKTADAVLVLLHGRGATAESVLSLYAALNLPTIAAVAPQAAGNTWYPHSFLAPIEANQPFLDSALRRVEAIVGGLIARGIPSERIALLGFSQGACLTSEYVARQPRRYGGLIALTGGLIGPPGTRRDYEGSLDGMPAFLGSGDPDPHVPFDRVEETAAVFKKMGAEVDLRRYPNMPHTINDDEFSAARSLLARIAARRR
jgi:predicted esterase